MPRQSSKKQQDEPWRNRIVGHGNADPKTLSPHPLNWRTHPEYQKDALDGVLREVGWVQQIVVNQRTGTMIDGHLRVALALEQKAKEVPVVYVDLGEEEERLVLATLDPISAQAEADAMKLKALLDDVSTGDAAIQQMLSDLAEKAGIFSDLGGSRGDGEIEDIEPEIDRGEELREKWGVEEGQLWELGNHRLICGDCLEEGILAALLADEIPAMIFADPPYGVNIVATNGYVGGGEAYDIPFGGVKNRPRHTPVGGGEAYKAKHGIYPIQRGKKGLGTIGGAKPFGSKKVRGTDGAANIVDVGKYAPVEGDDSTATAIQAVTSLLTVYPQAIHIWWGGNYYASALPDSPCWLIWDKETTGHFADCELAWTNQPRAARLFRHRWNGMLRDSERERRWHPTQKPAALAAWVYDTMQAVGDSVLDPFLGSGPSLIAGEQRQKRVHACEKTPEYIAVSIERWHQLTGKTPKLISQ